MAYTEVKDSLPAGSYSIPMEEMGDRIKTLRQARSLTQEQLAERLGVSKMAVSQWETGATKNPGLKTFLALCDELATTPHYLIFGADHRTVQQRRRQGP